MTNSQNGNGLTPTLRTLQRIGEQGASIVIALFLVWYLTRTVERELERRDIALAQLHQSISDLTVYVHDMCGGRK